MSDESREYAMNLLVTMVVQKRAERSGLSFEKEFSEFRRSKTFEMLYDADTGLWMNGPDYISDEYDIELERNKETR